MAAAAGVAPAAAGAGGGAGAAIGAAGVSGSMDIFSSMLGAVSAKKQNEKAAKEAQKAREWAEQMRATAYQTMVKDLEAAGLNPVLAVSGAPSSTPTPSGPVAQVTRPDFSSLRGAAGRMIASAKQAQMMDDQVKTVAANRRSAEAEAGVAERSADYRVGNFNATFSRTMAEGALAEQQAIQSGASRRLTDVRARLERLGIPAAEAESELDTTEFGENLRKFRRVMEALPSIGGSIRRPYGRARGEIRSR